MNNSLKAAIYIAIGASCYGMLATFVKYANNSGQGTGALIFSQYLFGLVVLSIGAYFFSRTTKKPSNTSPALAKFKLVLFGTSLGLTSSFYYLSIQHVPVSVGIILLMQTIWMGVLLELFMARHLVTLTKIMGAIVAIAGTLLAAKIFETDVELNWTGIGYGLLAAASYTAAMYASNRVSLELPLMVRSQYLVLGGFVVVLLFWNIQILDGLSLMLFLKWGTFLGLFGTILPPLFFNQGFPVLGTGLGSIISALEIPVSVLSAYLVLKEAISPLQWLGIIIILLAVTLINWKNIHNRQKISI